MSKDHHSTSVVVYFCLYSSVLMVVSGEIFSYTLVLVIHSDSFVREHLIRFCLVVFLKQGHIRPPVFTVICGYKTFLK